MDNKKEIQELSEAMTQLNKEIENAFNHSGNIISRAQNLDSFSNRVLKSILFGIIGFVTGGFFAILLSQLTDYNIVLLSCTLTVLFSTLGVVISLFQSKGGNSIMKYDLYLENIDFEIERQGEEIKKLQLMNAPESVIQKRWDYLDDLENQRSVLIKAKSETIYTQTFNKRKNDFNDDMKLLKEGQEKLILKQLEKEKLKS
ncbi:MAG: hypothetical protein AAFY48_13045 [Bacteroidota bacterium]